MISGNCNRSPQYNAMGPPGGGAQRYNPQTFIHQQHPQQHLLFMSGGGGNTRAFPPMSRGFSMMSNHHVGGVGSHPTVFQCNMQQGIGNSFGYHHANPTAAPIFHQQHHHLYQQPQILQHHPQQPQYVPQQYIAPPQAASHNEPTSGFINGIKNMVKGIIHPLNCDFYSDHHKYYNPKYRNNYMRDIKAENMHYKPQTQHPQSNSHVQTVVVGLEINKPSPTKVEEKKKPTTPTLPQECTKKSPEVVAIFSSDDFPELPAPRRSRSVTPAKTESTPPPKSSGCEGEKVQHEESPSRKHPPPKGTFFEVTIRTTPSGKRPTFGGRLKVVPPPFSLNKSPRSCRSRQESSCSYSSTTNNNNNNNNKDCDIEEDSFVIFSNNEKPGECMFTSFSRPPRQRKMSECSDDSFVVFFTEDADCLGGLQCIDDDDDDLDELYDSDDSDSDEEETSSEEEDSCDDEGSEDDDEDEEDGIDVVDSSFLGRHNKTDRNKCGDIGGTTTTTTTNSLLQQIPCDGVVVPREHKQLDSGFDEKKVTFDPHPVVHVMHAWNYAYRAARKGHWEDFARDRTRFQQRIERTSVYLNPVLTPEHREKIYHSRFCGEAACSSNQQQQQQQQQQQEQSQQSPILTVDQARSHHRASASCNDDNQKLPKLTKLPDCASF